jgi:hypothetical protein
MKKKNDKIVKLSHSPNKGKDFIPFPSLTFPSLPLLNISFPSPQNSQREPKLRAILVLVLVLKNILLLLMH